MALFGIDFGSLFSAIKGFLGPFGKLMDSVKEGYDHVTHILSDTEHLFETVRDEIEAWKNFKEDVRFKQRVVNLESAIQKTRDLIEGIPQAWKAILDVFHEIRSKVGGGAVNPAEEAEAAVEDVETSGGISALLKRFPALARGLEKVLGAVTLIVDALASISKVIGDVQTVVDELKRIRLEIEKLDTIFLSQSNKRKVLKLADGSSIRVRVGKLHPA